MAMLGKRKQRSAFSIRTISKNEMTAMRLAGNSASATTITMRDGLCDVQPAQRLLDTRPGAPGHAIWYRTAESEAEGAVAAEPDEPEDEEDDDAEDDD